jgi:hypothetical protein
MSMICLSDFFTSPEPPAGESRTDLHRDLRVVRDGAKQPPPGLARDLITHVLNRQQRQQPSRPGECLIHPDQPEVGVLRAAQGPRGIPDRNETGRLAMAAESTGTGRREKLAGRRKALGLTQEVLAALSKPGTQPGTRPWHAKPGSGPWSSSTSKTT